MKDMKGFMGFYLKEPRELDTNNQRKELGVSDWAPNKATVMLVGE